MKISLLNMNFWKSVYDDINFIEKQDFLVEKIMVEKPSIFAINEHASGPKIIKNLEKKLQNKYNIIKPVGFDNTIHNRSLQNLLLIKKEIKYVVRDMMCCLPNRLNVVDAYLLGDDNSPIHIINTYMVQTAILPAHMRKTREKLHAQLWKEIIQILKSFEGEPVILIGDLQEESRGEHIQALKKLGYYELVEGFAPVSTFSDKTIDHILFSEETRKILYPHNFSVSSDGLSISDHPSLSVEVA